MGDRFIFSAHRGRQHWSSGQGVLGLTGDVPQGRANQRRMQQGMVIRKGGLAKQACSGCHVGIPEPDGGRFAD